MTIPTQPPPGASALQKDLHDLSEIRDRMEAAENSGDADYMGTMLADDAVLMVPNFPVQEGTAACTDFTRDVLTYLHKTFDRHISYFSAEVRVIGDYAFDWGTFSFTVTPKDGGDTEHPSGKYFWLYSRIDDGSWKVARIIVSLDEDDEEGS